MNEKGERAMEYISDYPLYAKTSGITYEEAIAIAEVLSDTWEQDMKDMEEFDKLSPEQKKAILDNFRAEGAK